MKTSPHGIVLKFLVGEITCNDITFCKGPLVYITVSNDALVKTPFCKFGYNKVTFDESHLSKVKFSEEDEEENVKHHCS